MQVTLLAVLSIVACASSTKQVESLVGYHIRVGIPMAEKIKAAEDAITANSNPNARMVGGNIAAPNAHPFFGGILITYANHPGLGVCGSVLVSRTRLLTAAHCWYDAVVQASRFTVILGSIYLFSGGDRIATSNVITYPGWNPVTQENNLAVIVLTNPVMLTANIQPIALATNVSETYAGESAIAVGYGFTSDAQTSIPVGSILNEARLQVIPSEECHTVYGSIVGDNTVCTSGTGGVGTCKGDAGGPLYVNRNGQRELIGIISFSAAEGCEVGLPSGYSRITSFLKYIQRLL